MTQQKTTSWGNVADWYDKHLAGDDTYHAKVIAPNVLRLVEPKAKKILEIGCGEGYFSRLLAEAGASIDASDIAPELIAKAKEKDHKAHYFVASADKLSFATNNAYDSALAVLTIQNMERIAPVFKEVARTLKEGGEFVIVLNHPAFRIPKQSHWEFDEKEKVQYRRIDAYMSASKVPMDMHPGDASKSDVTYSFHRPLQEYVKSLANAGFVVSRLEEWTSHKTSAPGPRADAENKARHEFPLFMCIVAEKR